MFTDVMIDLETMSTQPNAAIIAIGAVKFNAKDSSYAFAATDDFYVRVDLSSSMKYGLDVSASTVEWWMHPDRNPARPALFRGETVNLAVALGRFSQWFGSDRRNVWGNGAAFDNVILRNAFEVAGFQAPWQYIDDRCYRTIKAMTPQHVMHGSSGVHHNALDDARHQARDLIARMQYLRS